MVKAWDKWLPNLREYAGHQCSDQYAGYPSGGDHGQIEIIDIAQAIDTFEISIQPFEDCCTIFAPDRPKTNPKLKNAEQYEQRMDVEALVERAAGIIVTEITPKAEKDEVDDLIEDLL